MWNYRFKGFLFFLHTENITVLLFFLWYLGSLLKSLTLIWFLFICSLSALLEGLKLLPITFDLKLLNRMSRVPPPLPPRFILYEALYKPFQSEVFQLPLIMSSQSLFLGNISPHCSFFSLWRIAIKYILTFLLLCFIYLYFYILQLFIPLWCCLALIYSSSSLAASVLLFNSSTGFFISTMMFILLEFSIAPF